MGAQVSLFEAVSVTPAQAGLHSRGASGVFLDVRIWVPDFPAITRVFV